MAETDERQSGTTRAKSGTPPSEKTHDRIKGVFSTQSIQRVGTGTTTRKTIQKMYWFVEERDDKLLDIQPLNRNYIPTGPKRKVTMEELLEKFAPEPEFYVSTVYPKMRELNMTIVKGENHRRKGEVFSAELEFGQALAVDEENVRANFGLGLTYLDRGEANKAQDIFERLVNLDAAFDQEHKHLFNEFGINLRKNKMLDQALDYYRRAENLSEADENLHYNIARPSSRKMTSRCVSNI
jgi:tetratricopeptide (TPR) repeat protein